MTNEAGPNLVYNGLVLNLDAANSRSYPGSGTSWTSVASGNDISTLVGSPTYSSLNNGFFTFNGSSSYAIIPNNTALDTQTPSVEVWIKTNSLSQNGFLFEKGTVNTQYSLFQNAGNSSIYWRQYFSNLSSYNELIISTSNINTSNWYQIVGTFTSGRRRIYINGQQIAQDSQAGTIGTSVDGMSVGVYGGFSGGRSYYYNGSISICRVYNKELSATEVLQNFNATKGRYGL